jgi:hypothetical protein
MWGSKRCYILSDGVSYTKPCVLYDFIRIIREASGVDASSVVDLCVLETNESKRRSLTAEQATKLAEVLKSMPRRAVTVQEESVTLALAFELGRLEIRMSSNDTAVVFTDDEAFITLFKDAKISYGKVVIISPRRMQISREIEDGIRYAMPPPIL